MAQVKHHMAHILQPPISYLLQFLNLPSPTSSSSSTSHLLPPPVLQPPISYLLQFFNLPSPTSSTSHLLPPPVPQPPTSSSSSTSHLLPPPVHQPPISYLLQFFNLPSPTSSSSSTSHLLPPPVLQPPISYLLQFLNLPSPTSNSSIFHLQHPILQPPISYILLVPVLQYLISPTRNPNPSPFPLFNLPPVLPVTPSPLQSHSLASHLLPSLPWYNSTGWLGVKHQVTCLLLPSLVQLQRGINSATNDKQ